MEKIYYKMQHSGLIGIITGICAMIIGILMVISGAMLLKNKKDILF